MLPAISTDDFDAGVGFEPGFDGADFPIWQQINGAMFFKVNRNGSIPAALLKGKVVYSQSARRLDGRRHGLFKCGKESIGAQHQAERLGNTGSGFSANEVSQLE